MKKISMPNRIERQHVFFLAISAYFIFITFVDVFPIKSVGERFIGHADAANLAILARNMAEGKGAVTDVVWLLRGGGMQYNSLTHPEDYWSLYSAAIVALFFKWLGASKLTLLLSASIMKSLIAIISAIWVWRFSKGSFLATTAIIIFVTLWPGMIDAVSGLSDIYLTASMLLSMSAFCFAMTTRKVIWFAVAGLLSGVAIGIKPSGGLLLGVPLFMLMCNPKPLLTKCNVLYMALGIALGCSWLAVHNYQAYGHLNPMTPPAHKLVSEAASIRANLGSHDVGFYDPTPITVETTWTNKARHKLLNIEDWFRDGLQRGEILSELLLFFFLAFFWEQRSHFRKDNREWAEENTFALIGMLMLGAGLVLLLVVHYEKRYWNFLFPFVAIIATLSMYRKLKIVLVLSIIFSVISGLVTYHARHKELVPPIYEQISKYIPPDKTAMINDPWEFTYHTRIKSIMAPVTDDEAAIVNLAKKYQIDYLIVIREKVRHQLYRDIFDGKNSPQWLCPWVRSNELYIGKIGANNCLDGPVSSLIQYTEK